MKLARPLLSSLLTWSLVAGCQSSAPVASTGKLTRPAVTRPAGSRPAIAPAGPERVFDPAAEAARRVVLTGQVLLISDKGLGLIGNHGGGLISDRGASIVGNQAAGVISNNAGNLISDKGLGYRLLDGDAPLAQYLLADAELEVLDARGRRLVDPRGEPITAVSDRKGAYRFEATLPDENLVMRVRLFPRAAGADGTLLAMLPRAKDDGPRELVINTASSLGAAYVLDQYVKESQSVYDRLPASEAEALQRELMAAYDQLPLQSATYRREDMVQAAEAVRARVKQVDLRLDAIKAILLAGQLNWGDGLSATEVSFPSPRSAVLTPDGRLAIAEAITGRIRVVQPDGTVKTVAQAGMLHDMVAGPDGGLYLVERYGHRVSRLGADGVLTPVAGTGKAAQSPLDVPAPQAGLDLPMCLAFGPEGALYIGENPKSGKVPGRLLRVGTDGLLTRVDAPWSGGSVVGLAATRDGGLWVLIEKDEAGQLLRRAPDGSWRAVVDGFAFANDSRLALGPDETLYVSSSATHQVLRLGPDETLVPFAGTGAPGDGGDGGAAVAATLSKPAGLFVAPDGTCLITDIGANLIRAVGPDGTIRTIAGLRGAAQEGDASGLPLSMPGGIAIDPQGRVVVAEGSSGTIKRLEDGKLTTIAGTTVGFSGDGGPATEAQFDQLGGIWYHGDTLYVLSLLNPRLRKIDESGIVTTVAGDGTRGPFGGPLAPNAPALGAIMKRPLAVTIDPDGRPVWSDSDNHWILRLRADGTVERVAGAAKPVSASKLDPLAMRVESDVPASEATLLAPSALIYDAEGSLYVADSGKFAVRKIRKDGTITTVAGKGPLATIAALPSYAAGSDDDMPAKEALLLFPGGMALDAEGNLYVSEAGTRHLDKLGAFGELSAHMTPFGGRVRKIAKDGTITTIAGPGGKLLTDGELGMPTGLAIDREGRLLVADSLNHVLLAIPKSAL